jgi:N-methylhydantoinase A
VSLSSAIAPEIREYPRASTTVANAYVGPIVRDYLGAIERGLLERGATLGLWLMKSNGGIATSDAAVERPVEIIESGPAAGLAAAGHYAALVGSADLVSLDMGGTTAKVGMIERGETRQIQGWELGAGSGSGSAVAHASGLPILGSVVDLVEIGAGGGSIAWIDAGGILRVGPRSAGADPGPACYGRGGTQPTVTDANVVLGRIGTAPLAGGRLPLNADAAHEAVAGLGARLGVSTLDAAVAIIEVADSAMVRATRLMTVRRGLDPAGFDLLAFGGAGPLHACRQASELGFRSVIVPPDAGVLSAFGLLASAPRVDHRTAFRRRLDLLDPAEADATLERLEREALIRLPEAARGDDLRRDRGADMRYVGQSWDLRVPIPAGPFDVEALANLRRDFDSLHERAYGYAAREAPVETVHLAITLAAPRPIAIHGPSAAADAAVASSALIAPSPVHHRDAYVGTEAGMTSVPVHQWADLRPGESFDGPALIDGPDTTAYVAPGFRCRVGPVRVLHLVPS